MVLQKGRGNRVLRHNMKIPFSPLYRQIVIDPQASSSSETWQIWAKAKNVLRDVGPVVGTTKRLDVTRFSICARGSYESCTAHVAGKIGGPSKAESPYTVNVARRRPCSKVGRRDARRREVFPACPDR
jgi:hypothetical protein